MWVRVRVGGLRLGIELELGLGLGLEVGLGSELELVSVSVRVRVKFEVKVRVALGFGLVSLIFRLCSFGLFCHASLMFCVFGVVFLALCLWCCVLGLVC